MRAAVDEQAHELDGHGHRLWVRPSQKAVGTELARWVTSALHAGDKVLIYQQDHGAGDGRATTERDLVRDGVDPAALARGQVEVRSAAQLRATTGGDWHAMHDVHLASLARAHREGFRAVALTSDGAALHESVPDTDHLISHEKDLSALADAHPFRVLCRYVHDQEQPRFLENVVEVHYRNIQTHTWSCTAQGNHLTVTGEVDASTATYWQAVLHAAIDDSITEIDVSRLRYLSAAGIGALSQVAERLSRHGAELMLYHPPRQLQRMLDRLELTNHPGVKFAGKERAQ